MQRPFHLLLLWALLTLVLAPTPAMAQRDERSPDELWKAFPLAPAPTTPGEVAPTAEPPTAETPTAQRPPETGGTSSAAALTVLLAGVVLIGALALFWPLRRWAGPRRVQIVLPVRTRDPDARPGQALWSVPAGPSPVAGPPAATADAAAPAGTVRHEPDAARGAPASERSR